MNAVATERVRTENPFPGLRPFSDDEGVLFFGREDQVDVMVNKLASTRFLVVLGASGSGKSSLVNCGLRPALYRGLMSGALPWRIVQFRPGSAPVNAMAKALASDRVLFPAAELEGLTTDELLETTLRLSRLGLVDVFEQPHVQTGSGLLVVVDQFEELFRYRRAPSAAAPHHSGPDLEAKAFVNLLLEAAKQRALPIYVVLTLRSDFLGDCAQFRGLPEAINQGEFLVPRLSREERRAAIRGPIALAGAEVSEVLLTRLVNDAGEDPDQLSILQHALHRTWDAWEERGAKGPISLEHYEAIGTMADALDQHAEEAFGDLAAGRQQTVCEKLFKALTDKSTDARGVRRPARLDELCVICGADEAELSAVIDVFRDPRRAFLMPPDGELLSAGSVIDISHESLMRVWKRLRRWTDEEAASAEMYRKLQSDALLHEQGKRSLWRDPELRAALNWRANNRPTEAWASRYVTGFESAMTFLNESAAAERRKQVTRRLKIWGTVAAAFFAVAYFAWTRSEEKKAAEKKLEDFLVQNPQLRSEVRALRETNRDLRLEVLRLSQTNDWLQTAIKHTKTYNTELATFIAGLERRKQQLIKRREQLATDARELEASRDASERETVEADKVADDLRAANRELREKLLAAGFVPAELPLPRVATASMQVPESTELASFPEAPELMAALDVPAEGSLESLENESQLLLMLQDELKEENRKLLANKSQLEAQVGPARAVLDELESATQTAKQKESSLRSEIGALEEAIVPLADKTTALQREISVAKAKRAAFERWSRELRDDYALMERTLSQSASAAAGKRGKSAPASPRGRAESTRSASPAGR